MARLAVRASAAVHALTVEGVHAQPGAACSREHLFTSGQGGIARASQWDICSPAACCGMVLGGWTSVQLATTQ